VPADRIAAAHAVYAAERDALIDPDHTGPRPSGGVAEPVRGQVPARPPGLVADRCRRPGGRVDGPKDRTPPRLTGAPRPVGARRCRRTGCVVARAHGNRHGDRRHRLRHQLDEAPGGRCGRSAPRTSDAHHPAGQGVDATGRLAPEAIDRCVAVLAEFRQVMDHFDVGRGRLAATSAARDAANGAEFLAAAAAPPGSSPSC